MDGRTILSGSQLVAKGATKKVDGQLPEAGLKDVTSDGSWLEQKQIQSALEARKHLIAVERIEKSGSLSHAEWRDDLKLAEVTKQTGGHWQYIGHKRGKYLYLLPEETLFLIETNSLLLKHNDVTVSLQKAYSLCLSEMTITQYKVYSSLSRLGYRVFRHKKPTSDEQIESEEKIGTTPEENPETSQSMNLEQSDSINSDNNKDMNENNDPKTAGNDATNSTNETPLNHVCVNNAHNSEDAIVNKSGEAVDSENIDKTKKNAVNATLNHSNRIENDKSSQQNMEMAFPVFDVTNNDKDTSMDIDDNANETRLPTNENSTVTSHGSEANLTETGEASNEIIAEVYSVDEFGVIRVFEKDALMDTDEVESNVENTDIDFDCNTGAKDSSTNDSGNHFQIDIKHYDDKIKKLTERKSKHQINNQGLDTIQDFYKQQIINVIVPDETYLPRNIFLHKTEYTLNMETVRNQNATNVNDETDSIESSSTPAHNMNSQRLTEIHRSPTFNTNTQPRYPTYHHQRPHYNQRLNFNNYMFRMPNFYFPRYHPNTYVRQHYMVYNSNMSGMNHTQSHYRRDVIKKYHYEMIVNIATRLKNGLALPSQVRALQSLLNTYNLRYNTHIRMTQDFTIVGTTDTVPVQNVIELENENVVNLDDDEPKVKKQRLNDDNTRYNSNLEKLKELAAKLKELHAKNLAVSRHRRVFSNAVKTFNKSFKADLYLDSNFEIVDRKTVVVDTSSDSDPVVVEEMPKRRKKLRNPYSILKRIARDVNIGASTSQEVPVLRTLSLNVINDTTSPNTTRDNANTASIVVYPKDEDLLKRFYESRFSGNDGFGGAELCSQLSARLDALLFQAEYLNDVLKEPVAEFESWVEIKLAILKDIRGSLNIQKQQVEALSSDFFTTEYRIQPIVGPDCTDLKTALKKLAIIPTNKEIPVDTNLKIHFDVCNRDVHFKKTNPPKPNFRVVCYEESAPFPSTEDVVALHAKYTDDVPIVFAFVGISASISYLQINPVDLPVFIPDNYIA